MESNNENPAFSYPESSLLVAMAETAWAGNLKSVKIEFSLSDKLKEKLTELLGKEIHKIFITDSDARHIRNHHGKNEKLRGQVDITPADFAFIPVILNEYDTARQIGEDKKGNKKLEFTKKIEGNFYLISIVKGNNQVGIITLWKKKSPIGCLMLDKIPQGTRPPKPTSETTPTSQ